MQAEKAGSQQTTGELRAGKLAANDHNSSHNHHPSAAAMRKGPRSRAGEIVVRKSWPFSASCPQMQKRNSAAKRRHNRRPVKVARQCKSPTASSPPAEDCWSSEDCWSADVLPASVAFH